MYGYIRPARGELRVRDYELYQALYCGLCRTLGERYGLAARFTVNYDLTFLAMLLAEGGGASCRRRCIVHPLRARPCLRGEGGLNRAAACCVILAWWKLEDKRRDGGLLERLAARAGKLLLRRAYRRAAADDPAFDAAVRENLGRLAGLEDARSPELDAPADCFARLLAAAGECAADEGRRRVLRELLYHVGRSVYILDAADDLPADVRHGAYNPLRGRFGDGLSAAEGEELRGTLNLSQRRAAAAWELLPRGRYTDITENILLLGLPAVTTAVLSGQWRERRKSCGRTAESWREKI